MQSYEFAKKCIRLGRETLKKKNFSVPHIFLISLGHVYILAYKL